MVREVLDELHAALSENQIFAIKFAWIKYITNWPHLGPGYYAGINSSKKGQWIKNIVAHHSARHSN